MQLTVRNVTLGYEQSVVSEKINFEMGQGDYLCVVGENGAGKSTLMKAILGLKTADFRNDCVRRRSET